MTIKICITTLEYPPDVGGVGESVCRIAKMLTQAGYEVHVAVFRSKQRLVAKNTYRRSSCKTTIQDKIFIHRIKSAARDNITEVTDFFADVFFQLKDLHQKYKFDIFHAFFLVETGYVTTMLARENNIPVINSVRGSDLHKHLFNPKNYGQIAWVLENSAWTTFVSNDLQKRAHILVPSIKSKSSTFWNSIVPIDFTTLPKPTLINELSGVVIGTTGRFRDKKGIEYLLDACSKLNQEIDITLLLIGDFVEKERLYWQHELQQCTLRNNLRITGMKTREETLAYLPYLDIFAIPSLTDGCPNSLLEAMLAGCAIVGTNVDAIGEIIKDNINGLLVNPANSAELAAALKYLIDNPELGKKMGIAAKAKAIKELAPTVELENWLNIYQRVLQPSDLLTTPHLSIV